MKKIAKSNIFFKQEVYLILIFSKIIPFKSARKLKMISYREVKLKFNLQDWN
jgi:hypothetical protein